MTKKSEGKHREKTNRISRGFGVGLTACPAQILYTVTLDASPLIGNANGPFLLEFQLSDGSGTNDGNNIATLSHFNFGSVAAIGAPKVTSATPEPGGVYSARSGDGRRSDPSPGTQTLKGNIHRTPSVSVLRITLLYTMT